MTSPRFRPTRFLAAAAIAVTSIVAPAVVSPAPASASTSCPNGMWSPTFQGRPASLTPGAAAGVYLWHDGDGWSLRVTHPGSSRMVVTGTIDSSREITAVTRALESNDRVTFNSARAKINFRLENKGRIDGIDFKVGCSERITISARINGAPASTVQFHLGAGGVAPTSVPFVAERT
jgi:hypothetical protein